MRVSASGRRCIPAVLLWLSFLAACSAAKTPTTVAVLPFQRLNLPDSPKDVEYPFLEKAFVDTVSVALARVKGVRVVERPARGTPAEKSRQGADTVVMGTFARVGAEMRVKCRLVDVATGKVDVKHSVVLKRKVESVAAARALAEDLAVALLRTYGVTPTEKQRRLIREAARHGEAAQADSTPMPPAD